jgi:hypothetical protein
VAARSGAIETNLAFTHFYWSHAEDAKARRLNGGVEGRREREAEGLRPSGSGGGRGFEGGMEKINKNVCTALLI